MSMTWNPPHKARVYEIDDSPLWHSEGWETVKKDRRRGKVWKVEAVIVFGLLVWFWLEAVR